MARRARTASSTGASSTLRPAYITTTRCAISATTPRSWVISMIAVPVLSLQLAHQVEDLRLDRHVERGGRLVGDQQLRVAGQRHRDHHALPHAAGQLVRILRDAPLRLGDADQAQHLDRARVAPPRASSPLMQRQRLGDLPADGQHRVERGHRLLEDHRDLVAADRRASRASVSVEQVAALEHGSRPSTMRPGGDAIRRRIDSEVTLLPQPDSPTIASVSPRLDRERHAVDRAHDAVAREEIASSGPSTSSRAAHVLGACGHRITCAARGAGRARRACRRRAG